MMAEYILALATGFLGSLHCIGMCGPIVLAYSPPMRRLGCDGSLGLLPSAHVFYNLGRITTYTILGALAGAFGRVVIEVGHWAGVRNAAVVIFGIGAMIVGLSLLDLIPALNPIRRWMTSGGELLQRLLGPLIISSRASNKYALGLVLGFLPCGLLYGMLLAAAATASPLRGGLIMASFGFGTIPALLAVGLASSLLAQTTLRRWGEKLGGIGMILLGALILLRGVGIPLPWLTHAIPGASHAPLLLCLFRRG